MRKKLETKMNKNVQSTPISPNCDQCEVDEIDVNRCFPWIKVTIKFLKSLNYTCSHNNLAAQSAASGGTGNGGIDASGGGGGGSSSSSAMPNTTIRTRRQLNESCCKDCYLRLFKNSHSLVEAVLRMYETSKNSILFERYEKQLRARSTTTNTTSKDSMKKYGTQSGGGFGLGGGDDLGRNSTKIRKVNHRIFTTTTTKTVSFIDRLTND